MTARISSAGEFCEAHGVQIGPKGYCLGCKYGDRPLGMAASDRWQLLQGRCEEVLATMPDNSVDSIVTDPPYELGFMGKHWDASGIAYSVAMWREALRVLKPGGYLLAFGGTRTYHRMAVAIEDAGFVIRDSIHWLYGSGFPKSLNIGKALDKQRTDDVRPVCRFLRAAIDASPYTVTQIADRFGFHSRMVEHWAARDTDSQPNVPKIDQWLDLKLLLDFGNDMDAEVWRLNGRKGQPGEAWEAREITGTVEEWADRTNYAITSRDGFRRDIPATEAAILWEGYGTALKPSHEPIVVAQKPLGGTYAANVIEWGCGALNIDGCRVANGDAIHMPGPNGGMGGSAWRSAEGRDDRLSATYEPSSLGRWPTNLVLTHSADCGEECAADCPVALLDRQSGTSGGAARTGKRTGSFGRMNDDGWQEGDTTKRYFGDQGGASRFYPTFRYTDEDFAPFLYCAKPSKAERNAGLASLPIVTAAEMTGRKEGSAGLSNPRAGTRTRTGAANHHPTVKPLGLMRWLVRLVTPHDGTTLDLFGGSGTTVAAAIREGKRAIAIEMTPEYWPIIRTRAAYHEEAARVEAEERQAAAEREARRGRQMTIFDVLPATVEPERAECRCWTCRGVFECERDEQTGKMVCHGCQGEKHRRHHAAWLARIMAEYQEGEDDGIDF